MTTFKRIEYKRKSAYAAEQILEAIRAGRYGVGDRLPPEREVAEQMGISRPLVREALSALQIVGVLESRPGNGTYVTRGASAADEVPALSLIEESDSLVEAFEARRLLEEGIVALACRKAACEDLDRLRRALEALGKAAEAEDFEAFNDANVAFHRALARAAHNGLLERALCPLLDVLHQELPRKLRASFYGSDRQRFRETYELHLEILSALERRDERRCASAMRAHFEVFERDLNA